MTMGLDEFIGHKTSGSGGANYLKGWKKQGWIEVWLHTQASFVALWRHNLPIIRAFEDRDTKSITRKIWTQNFVCLEPETVLRDQRRRDKDTDRRTAPPTICPVCLLLEDVYQRVRAGKLDLVEPVFKFELPEDEELEQGDTREVVLTAGGMCGLYNEKLGDEDKKKLKRAGIKLTEAWKENALAKCNYVFTVVDNAHPENGVQVAVETALLGDKVKSAIAGEMKRIGRDDGNPLKNPYAIRWEHHPREQVFDKKYAAFVRSPDGKNAVPLTDAIRELIEAEPPSIDRIKRPGNATSLRAQLEQYAVVDFDWDRLFAQAQKLQASEQSEDEGGDVSFDYGANVADDEVKAPPPKEEFPKWPEGKGQPKSEAKSEAKKEPEPAKPSGGAKRRVVAPPKKPQVPCDKCKAPMDEDAVKCLKCGTEYELVPDEPPAKPMHKGGPIHNEADTGQAGDDFTPAWSK